MRILTVRQTDGLVPAIEIDGLAVAVPGYETTSRMLERNGNLGEIAEGARQRAERGDVLGRVEELELGPPVPDPGKIICVGLNYDKHLAETGRDPNSHPVLFAKFANSLVGPDDLVIPPASTDKVDYEGEMAVVIGRRSKDVSEGDALDHVAGITVVNDVSARDLQKRSGQWLPGKAIDTFLPSGPALVTMDEVPDIGDLRLMTRVNGRTVQDAFTGEMIFDVPTLIASITELMTLEAGDMICTGTPGGVAMGMDPPPWLQNDDLVEVELTGVGTIHNRILRPEGR